MFSVAERALFVYSSWIVRASSHLEHAPWHDTNAPVFYLYLYLYYLKKNWFFRQPSIFVRVVQLRPASDFYYH